MEKLTNEQVRRAQALYAEREGREQLIARDTLERLAPLLQLPWDDPSSRPDDPAAGWELRSIHNSAICQWREEKLCRAVSDALREFVRLRNAHILGRTDLRRAKIIKVLLQYPDRAPEIADKILAVLDEEK